MKNVSINKKDIQVVRLALQLPLLELFRHMNSLGWNATLIMPDKHDGSVSFAKRDEWNGRPILASNCSYGYRFSEVDLSVITTVAQRAAELCLTVYETFGDLIPSNANMDGEIRPDFIANKPEYSNISYSEFMEKHADKKLSIQKECPWSPSGWFFSYYSYRVTIMPEDEDAFYSHIQRAKRTLSGEFAIID